MLRIIKNAVIYIAIFFVVLLLFDLALIRMNLFPTPQLPIGNKDVGHALYFHPIGTENLPVDKSYIPRFKGKKEGIILLNEYDFRSTRSIKKILEEPLSNFILVLGDSHTDLPYANDFTHPFILERALLGEGMNDAEVFNAGQAKFSPLQSHMLYKYYLKQFNPKAIILNLYSGNDFYDLIRVDDRPYFVADGADNYKINPPEWVRYRAPDSQGTWVDQSRILYVFLNLPGMQAFTRNWTRIKYLLSTSEQQEQGILSSLRYIWDIKNSVEPSLWYPGAYSAQILNQQLFFKHFPTSKEESIRRLSYLMKMMKEENPEMLLILSPIPSAALAGALKDNPVFQNRIEIIGLKYDEIFHIEKYLYEKSRNIAEDAGWAFVDILQAFQSYPKPQDLYMGEDLHISPEASRLIGEAEAGAILPILRNE
jgi:hypothetical protein